MRTQTSCFICNTKLTKYACRKCGALVCVDCYDKDTGKCINCKQGVRIEEEF